MDQLSILLLITIIGMALNWRLQIQGKNLTIEATQWRNAGLEKDLLETQRENREYHDYCDELFDELHEFRAELFRVTGKPNSTYAFYQKYHSDD